MKIFAILISLLFIVNPALSKRKKANLRKPQSLSQFKVITKVGDKQVQLIVEYGSDIVIRRKDNGYESMVGVLKGKDGDFLLKKLATLPGSKMSNRCAGPQVEIKVSPSDNLSRSVCIHSQKTTAKGYVSFANLVLFSLEMSKKRK